MRSSDRRATRPTMRRISPRGSLPSFWSAMTSPRRTRAGAGLRLAVADTLAEGEDLEVELAYLKAVFS